MEEIGDGGDGRKITNEQIWNAWGLEEQRTVTEYAKALGKPMADVLRLVIGYVAGDIEGDIVTPESVARSADLQLKLRLIERYGNRLPLEEFYSSGHVVLHALTITSEDMAAAEDLMVRLLDRQGEGIVSLAPLEGEMQVIYNHHPEVRQAPEGHVEETLAYVRRMRDKVDDEE